MHNADRGTVLPIGTSCPVNKAVNDCMLTCTHTHTHTHTQTADIIATELNRRVEVVKDPRLREKVGYCVFACM